jgi:YfiR/HmsC-like
MTRRANMNIGSARLSGCATCSRLLALAIAAGLWLSTQMVAAQGAEPSEQQVKAAFLVNFPKYVEWPPECFAKTNEPIVLAILGDARLEDELSKMVNGKTINGHPLKVKRMVEAESAGACHLLFIGASAQPQWPKILENLSQTSVLTVGDSDEFLKAGGMIRLARRDRKIRLEVDLQAAQAARLQISSKLLAVADVVKNTSN